MSEKHRITGESATRIHTARSFLFVPGNRPDRFDQAESSAADVVICDLEDSVGTEDKDLARECVLKWLRKGHRAIVRLNAADTPHFSADCDALKELHGVGGLVLPKAEPDALVALSERGCRDIPVVALIETARGVQNAGMIATTPGVERLAFGAVDYSLDIDSAQDDLALLFARSSLVVASRAARIAAPVDGVTLNLDDADVAGADALRARQLGFGGKLCTHPNQIPAVNAAFAPTSEEADWARLVVAAATDSGAGRLGHSMIDRAVIERAQRILRWTAP
ncbi:MAG TPA: CoA ester lyase [Acidothermaceae bacterium]